jgi:hypothetical protein
MGSAAETGEQKIVISDCLVPSSASESPIIRMTESTSRITPLLMISRLTWAPIDWGNQWQWQ